MSMNFFFFSIWCGPDFRSRAKHQTHKMTAPFFFFSSPFFSRCMHATESPTPPRRTRKKNTTPKVFAQVFFGPSVICKPNTIKKKRRNKNRHPFKHRLLSFFFFSNRKRKRNRAPKNPSVVWLADLLFLATCTRPSRVFYRKRTEVSLDWRLSFSFLSLFFFSNAPLGGSDTIAKTRNGREKKSSGGHGSAQKREREKSPGRQSRCNQRCANGFFSLR